jgi:long-chain acyl-CoA synthetase
LEQRIIDVNSGLPAPPHAEGELQMRGPNVTAGYYKLPDETARLFTPDGWLRSGDVAKLDHDGHLSITGRIKEMLIIAGENVFPREIEEVLNQHPGVKASGVIGAPDPMRGELPVAFFEPVEGDPVDEQALKRWCRERLAGYKVPDRILRVDALPRNPTGKVVRRELKAML